MELTIRVQFLNEADIVSFRTNVLEVRMDSVALVRQPVPKNNSAFKPAVPHRKNDLV